MAVITDIHTYFGVFGLENGVSQVAGFKEELFPETGGMRDMVLPVLAQVGAIGIDYRGGVVQYACLLLFVYGYNHYHIVLLCIYGHPVGSGAGYCFRGCIPRPV